MMTFIQIEQMNCFFQVQFYPYPLPTTKSSFLEKLRDVLVESQFGREKKNGKDKTLANLLGKSDVKWARGVMNKCEN